MKAFKKYSYSLTDIIVNTLLIIFTIGISLLFDLRHTYLITMFITLGIVSVGKILIDFFNVIDTSKWLVICISVVSITLVIKDFFN